jgi:hypothetical protein
MEKDVKEDNITAHIPHVGLTQEDLEEERKPKFENRFDESLLKIF